MLSPFLSPHSRLHRSAISPPPDRRHPLTLRTSAASHSPPLLCVSCSKRTDHHMGYTHCQQCRQLAVRGFSGQFTSLRLCCREQPARCARQWCFLIISFRSIIERVPWSRCHVCAPCAAVVVGPRVSLCFIRGKLNKCWPNGRGVFMYAGISHLYVHLSSVHACNCDKENAPQLPIDHCLPLHPFSLLFIFACVCALFACCCRLCGL